MTGSLGRFWASLGFRTAAYFGLMVGITLLAAFAVIYLRTVGTMYQRITTEVSVAADRFKTEYAAGGLNAVSKMIGHALSDGIESHSELYLLADSQGRKLAGNLDGLGPMPSVPSGERDHLVYRGGLAMPAFIAWRTLSDGSLIVVGQDLREQENLRKLITEASAVAGIVALVLLVGGTLILRQELNRSTAELRRTAARVGAGDLQQRARVAASHDEFGLLHREVNQMLDRIQELMDGVRHVSDTIAHNLRTPLTHIMLRLRSAEQDGATDSERRDAIAEALRDLEELTVTFEKLLQIAEAEAGASRGKFEAVALHTVAGDVLELYDAMAEAQGTTLEHHPAKVAFVQGDCHLLAGALANLVDNALRHASSGKRVRLGIDSRGTTVLLTVQDDGPGIPEAEFARLGTRFHRLNRDIPGHGLGLASVRAIVTLHGGRIHFADAEPGLRVQIELPATPPPTPVFRSPLG
jgi:signal transduction histidine kinase